MSSRNYSGYRLQWGGVKVAANPRTLLGFQGACGELYVLLLRSSNSFRLKWKESMPSTYYRWVLSVIHRTSEEILQRAFLNITFKGITIKVIRWWSNSSFPLRLLQRKLIWSGNGFPPDLFMHSTKPEMDPFYHRKFFHFLSASTRPTFCLFTNLYSFYIKGTKIPSERIFNMTWISITSWKAFQFPERNYRWDLSQERQYHRWNLKRKYGWVGWYYK